MDSKIKIFVGVVVWIILTIIFILGLLIINDYLPKPTEQNNCPEIEKSLEQIKTGIRNSVIDVCFKLGGKWVVDQNKNFLFEEKLVVIDENRGIYQILKDYHCIVQGSQKIA